MKYLILFLMMASFVSVASADCQNNQININSASSNELEKLNGIGPVYAERIIEGRPFESVEDLVRINGIGEKTLKKIGLQDLACVEDKIVRVDEKSDEKMKNPKKITSAGETPKTNIAPQKEKIVLNSAVKNSEELVYESKNAKILKYAPYAFSVFLIFIIAILIFDK